ncbi:FG-GAP repeat domain-containing protein [Streptomyces sp. NPDC058700]|uniref:FG-GAP repeat domain-containing protein n=1 Tax=Streptomyces sp. NPDC058700 TaxID=3346607 RepID=UPI00364E6D34
MTRISGRRLAAAVLTLATVTAVTGTLVTAPAFAAPAAPVAATPLAATASVTIPADAEIVSSGTTGFMTSRPDGAGGTTLSWTNLADGTVTGLPGSVGHSNNSDAVVTSDGGTYYFTDMSGLDGAGTFMPSINLAQALGPEAVFVGASGDILFATKPYSPGKLELYRVAWVNGVLQKQVISYGNWNTGFKVVGSAAGEAYILGSDFDGARTRYFSTTYKLAGGGQFGLYDYTKPAGPWTAKTTGAISPAYQARTERVDTATEAVVYTRATYTTTRYPLSLDENHVVAGLTGDWLLHGLPGGASATSPNPAYALTARSLTGTGTVKLLDHFTSAATAPDGSVLVRGGSATEGEGLYRISDSGGTPSVTQVASAGVSTPVQLTGSSVPTVVDLDKNGGKVALEWNLSRPNVDLALTLTHVKTGKTYTERVLSGSSTTARITWSGVLENYSASAPNGDWTWSVVAAPDNGIGSPAHASGTFKVVRQANPHDLSDNGSADIVARDASGGLWRDDTFDWPVAGQIKTSGRTKIGTGWGIYNQIEAAGNLAGGTAGDFVARDTAGVLWSYLGTGNDTLAARTKIGTGWGVYNKIAAGSDLTGDGRPDLLATDTSGVLWLYKATGIWQAPYAARVKAGTGWNIYNQITAVGNTAGTSAGDLLTRDTSGVLWLHLGKGDGTFSPRVRVGGGWGVFSQLVGAGDLNNDGRADLIGYGSGGTSAYLGTGSTTAPFTRVTTDLYAGEGTKFNSIS